MALSKGSKKHLETIADDALATFKKVADAARALLGNVPKADPAAFAAINSLNTLAVENLAKIQSELRESNEHLTREPAIARVVVADTAGKHITYYICRCAPIMGMASYRAPVGRLASLPVGESISLPKAGRVEIVEQARLRPVLSQNRWDSRNSIVEGDSYGPLTIESFRALLGLDV